MEILKPIENELKQTTKLLRELVSSRTKLLVQVCDHIVSSGGKRLRPVLAITSGKMVGANSKRLLPIAVAMEYIHTASLLHDDIVDGAKFRRGKPSANMVFGNDVAVLVGDYLFGRSINILSTYGNEEILKETSKSVQEMSEGEIIQLKNIGNINISKNTYTDIIYRKTASLLSTCCKVGALAGNTSGENIERLGNYGKFLGIAFQLIDDAFDYVSDPKIIGKPTGNDIREGKVTYPLLSILPRCTEDERKRIDKILLSKNPSADDIEFIKHTSISHGGIDATVKLAREYITKAKKSIDIFPKNPFRTLFENLADLTVNRNL